MHAELGTEAKRHGGKGLGKDISLVSACALNNLLRDSVPTSPRVS